MPEAKQRQFKAKPHNITAGLAKGLMAVRQDYCAADFGSVTVVGDGTFFQVGEENIIGFHIEEGRLEISLRLYSETDDLLLHIDRNEWVSGNPLPWDIEADWQILTLRERARQITLTINAKIIPLQVTGSFYRFGKKLNITKDGIQLGRKGLSGFSELALVGMLLSVDVSGINFNIGPRPNHPHAYFISWPNRRERLWKAKEGWRKIEAARSEVKP